MGIGTVISLALLIPAYDSMVGSWRDSAARRVLECVFEATASFETTYRVRGPWLWSDVETDLTRPPTDEERARAVTPLAGDRLERDYRATFDRGAFRIERLDGAAGSRRTRWHWTGEKGYVVVPGENGVTVVVRREMSYDPESQASLDVFFAVESFAMESIHLGGGLLDTLDGAETRIEPLESGNGWIINAVTKQEALGRRVERRFEVEIQDHPLPHVVSVGFELRSGSVESGNLALRARSICRGSDWREHRGAMVAGRMSVWRASMSRLDDGRIGRAHWLEYERALIRAPDEQEMGSLHASPTMSEVGVLVDDRTLGLRYELGKGRVIEVEGVAYELPDTLHEILDAKTWADLVPTIVPAGARGDDDVASPGGLPERRGRS